MVHNYGSICLLPQRICHFFASVQFYQGAVCIGEMRGINFWIVTVSQCRLPAVTLQFITNFVIITARTNVHTARQCGWRPQCPY